MAQQHDLEFVDSSHALRGKQYWRSLNELADTPEFNAILQREFPKQAGELDAPGRRTFLKLMAASLGLAGIAGCEAQSAAKIVPYVKAPEEIVPGKPLFYATALTLSGYARGVLVESNMGRPTKIEGNPSHPASLGAVDAMTQAAILSLYDPDRSQNVIERGSVSAWSRFATVVTETLAERKDDGAGLRILTESVTSPTLYDLLQQFLKKFPKAKWHQYEPVNRDNEFEGTKLAFGEPLNCVHHIENADVIVTLDADFVGAGPGNVRYAREFAARRRVRDGNQKMNRLYAIESTPTLTGANADDRLAVRASQMEDVIRELALQVGVANVPQIQSGQPPIPAPWMTALIHDLQQHRGNSLVIAGDSQPAEVHALAHAINETLGNTGKTVSYTRPVQANAVHQTSSLRELIDDLNSGNVEATFVLGGNPAYSAPVDLGFTAAFLKSKLRVHLGIYENETSALCHWHIPQAHELESWGDARAFDGTASIQQPLILPLYNGRSPLEMISILLGEPGRTTHEIVRDYWKEKLGPAEGFELAWRTALHDGLIKGSEFEKKSVQLKSEPIAIHDSPNTDLEINFRADPTIYDGRFINNGWLQELPKPISTLTWDNAVFIAPASAQRLNLVDEDVVELQLEGRSVRGPICILPGHAADAVTVHLGYGQNNSGRIGNGTGFNAYRLRSSKSLDFASNLTLQKTGARYALSVTQEHYNMHGRELVRATDLEEFKRNPQFAQADHQPPVSLYPERKYENHAWGMVIDTSACVGCNACMLACQAENNIPIVGKAEVANSREMHWIRVDRYFTGALDNPEICFQPVPCMQCENAPCELVCPVAATVHSAEGLNDMVYNRCIGTRYCSNNCPYKVRRFNFFQYSELQNPADRLRYNPEVTVRERGVMEKCTYCVQRINRVRIDAEKESRPIRDGEIVPACQQSCPADAIVFGDIHDPNSEVSKLKASPLNYSLLEELNTRPRTTYLARVRNPNPAIERLGAG